MIGLVVVSHSALLAQGVCELAGQVARGRIRLAPAGGLAELDKAFGTDAYRVLEAIESVYSEDGVIVLVDLGSAVLSAETALDLLGAQKRTRVRLCAAPLVEGAVAAASLAAAGAGLEEILREAQTALAAKASQMGADQTVGQIAPGSAERIVTLVNPLGLHARPAARLVRQARAFQARVTIENLSRGSGVVEAGGINSVLALGARQGHQLRLRAEGPAAGEALSQLAAFLASGCGELGRIEAAPVPAQPEPGKLNGIPASAGVAVGPLVRLRAAVVEASERPVDDPEAEWRRLNAAIQAAREETAALLVWAAASAGENEAGIFDAQVLFLEDPELLAALSRLILAGRVSAERAWQQETDALVARLAALDDAYLRARAGDATDVAARVMRGLTGMAAAPLTLSAASIVAAREITPSEVKDLDPGMVLGLCLEAASGSAHGVILARAMGIPAVVGLGPQLAALPEGTIVALDGEAGTVWISPGPEQAQKIEGRRQDWLAARREAQAHRFAPAATRDGKRIRVVANISGTAEAAEAVQDGAEGVGVLRTEFLFLGRAEAPSEEEQLASYLTVANSLGGRPLVVRTLDVGGDKHLPYVEIGSEANPFLGWRGIRLTLGRPELFLPQIRAILRAAAEHPVDLLLPMVATVEELREAKALVAEAAAELKHAGIAFGENLRIGVMIEVPSAVAVSDQLASEAGFFSIGTNDLVQYLMAADRTNTKVTTLADPFQPAVLRAIEQCIGSAHRAGIEVTLCGEMAADPLATPLLLGLDLDEFSVSAQLIPGLKRSIARWNTAEAEAVTRAALVADTSRAVRALLAGRPGGR